MKISLAWCLRFLPGTEDVRQLGDLLTGRGLEYEKGVHSALAGGIVAGLVTSCKQHPSKENLRVCEVNIGKAELLTIVCGAPNVRQGLIVAVGAAVMESQIDSIDDRENHYEIEDRDIHGVRSQGIIFSEQELGVGDNADMVIALNDDVNEVGEKIKVGDSLQPYLSLNDFVVEFGITPNRGDCLSHLGVAREIASAKGLNLSSPQRKENSDNDEQWRAVIADDARPDCPYYGCLLIRDVDCTKPSPLWMRTLIERCGGRSVNAVVDVTNYLMLAYGQPLHAFDADKIKGDICVRRAAAAGRLKVLDGSVVDYPAGTLLIADDAATTTNGAVALAGVMGGMDSGVTAQTRHVLLEAAHFTPAAVRGRARQFGVNSEAAFRFERGVDPTLSPVALTHAAAFIKTIGGGKIGKPFFAGAPIAAAAVTASTKKVRSVLGDDISDDEQVDLLNSLQLNTVLSDGILSVAVSPWRFDIEQEADIIEEIARARGYDNLPETMPVGGRMSSPLADKFSEKSVREFFTARGFYEIVTYSFVPEEWEEQLAPQQEHTLSSFYLINQMSEEMAVMRSTLWGGLLDRARYNARHKQERIRLFEIGRCFSSSFATAGTAIEDMQPLTLSGIVLGAAMPPHWSGEQRMTDFYDMKGMLEQLFAPWKRIELAPVQTPAGADEKKILHPGKSADIKFEGGDGVIGQIGELHPAQAFAAEFKTPPLLFSIYNMEHLNRMNRMRHHIPSINHLISPVSHFPPISRDLAVLVDRQAVAAGGELLACARKAVSAYPAADVQLFDFYSELGDNNGNNEGTGKISYGFRLTLQGKERNLTGDDINAVAKTVLDALQREFGAVLREIGITKE